jgi:UDP-GlcNAc3NAcA epimerase
VKGRVPEVRILGSSSSPVHDRCSTSGKRLAKTWADNYSCIHGPERLAGQSAPIHTHMNVVTIVGARPQFIKAAALARALERAGPIIRHYLIHTGQHYDREMSGAFFTELDIPRPDVNLGIGGGSHGTMTGRMLIAVERALMKMRPDRVLVYGDTDSTLAGALAAAKLHIPVGHVEAGLRSFNLRMPEEINRVLTDHISDLLFCPTQTAVENLAREGIKQRTALVGDVMYDVALYYRSRISRSGMSRFRVRPGAYFLATCHRAENTDDRERLASIFGTLARIASLAPVVLPLHPRTKRRLTEFQIKVPRGVRVLPPVGYLQMIALESNAIAILTDSGGIQKEAYFFAVPCITLRSETEWVETIDVGWNTLVGTDRDKTIDAARRVDEVRKRPRPPLFGNGDAAARIIDELVRGTPARNTTRNVRDFS